jgi:hypothetical protein
MATGVARRRLRSSCLSPQSRVSHDGRAPRRRGAEEARSGVIRRVGGAVGVERRAVDHLTRLGSVSRWLSGGGWRQRRHTRSVAGGRQYQIRPPAVTSYRHCGRSQPPIVRVASGPRRRCWRAGFSGAVGRSVGTIHACHVFGRDTRPEIGTAEWPVQFRGQGGVGQDRCGRAPLLDHLGQQRPHRPGSAEADTARMKSATQRRRSEVGETRAPWWGSAAPTLCRNRARRRRTRGLPRRTRSARGRANETRISLGG